MPALEADAARDAGDDADQSALQVALPVQSRVAAPGAQSADEPPEQGQAGGLGEAHGDKAASLVKAAAQAWRSSF